jgi:hypothetical protein
MRRLGPDEEIGVEVDGRVGATRAIDADGYAGVRAVLQITVHAQRNGDVGFIGEKHSAHGHRLQRLFGNVAQHCRGVEPDLGAIGLVDGLVGRIGVVPHDVMQWRREVGPAEPFGNDAIDARIHAVDFIARVDANDGADAHR